MSIIKIVTFVPLTHSEKVRMAMGDSGAGVIGNYDHCSFSSVGTGRFIPRKGAKPFIGQVGKSEEVDEERIEMICERSKAKKVLSALRYAHPYEEPAIDIYPLISEENL